MMLLDTTFLIDLIRGRNGIQGIINKIEGIQATTTINVHEFLVGGYGSTKSKKELEIRKSLLDGLSILPLSKTSAIKSAKLEAKLRKEGRFIGTADTLIAGIMYENGIDRIITRNVEHFNVFNGIEILSY